MQKMLSFLKLNLWRAILLFGVSLLTVYFFYRATFINFSLPIVVFSIILFLAELHTIFHLYGMFYSLWPRNYKIYSRKNSNKNLQINMFICVCGEPAEVVRQTILGAKSAVAYYKQTIHPKSTPKIYVLNDGKVAKKDNWREIMALAKELGVECITRSIPGGYKAGNINNALRKTPTSDPFNTLDIVFDADFAAKDYFLTEIVKPFTNKSIDFAQSPQRYKNEKTWVAKASAAHQIFFFDYICAAKGHDNALFLCGTNFAIRRSALDAVGGVDQKFITEDYATSLELHLSGHKGVFIPKVLAEGMAPITLKEYFSQQQRWSKGSLDVTLAYLTRILFGPMTIRQKFHYMLSATYYLIGLRDLILMLAPLPYLFFGVSLIKVNTAQYLFFVYGPLMVYNLILYLKMFNHPVRSLVLDIASFPVFTASALSSFTKRNLSFIVTVKKYEKENPFAVYKLQLMVAILLAVGLFFGYQHPLNKTGALLNYFWASFDMVILFLGFYLVMRENYNTEYLENKFFALRHISLAGFKSRAVLTRSFYVLLIFIMTGVAITQGVSISNSLVSLAQDQSSSYVPLIATPAPSKIPALLVPDKGVYYGYYQPSLDTHPSEPQTSEIAGEKTSLVMFYQDWSDTSFDTEFVKKLSQDGRVPVITWEPWDSNNKDNAKITAKYSPETIIAGEHDEFIKQWARGAASIKQPIFLRFAHEMNGDWYPWGNKNKAASYILMWQHVHDIFVEEGATNVIWVWSPNNTDQDGAQVNFMQYYPGDNYVDWVGMSGFNWGATSKGTHWTSFTGITQDAYLLLSQINKPIMVAETSSVSKGGNKRVWFERMLKEELPQFPRIKAVVFFDQNIENANFSLNSGQDFKAIDKNLILNNPYFLKYPIFN